MLRNPASIVHNIGVIEHKVLNIDNKVDGYPQSVQKINSKERKQSLIDAVLMRRLIWQRR